MVTVLRFSIFVLLDISVEIGYHDDSLFFQTCKNKWRKEKFANYTQVYSLVKKLGHPTKYSVLVVRANPNP